MTKSLISLLRTMTKKRATLSVTAPGDTNLSEANGFSPVPNW